MTVDEWIDALESHGGEHGCATCEEALPVLIAEIMRLRKAASRRHAEYPDPPNPKVEKIRAELSEQNRKKREGEGK